MDAQFNSVFDDAVEVEKNFDTIFGGQEDDELMGIVLGEAADDDVDFETLDDGITPNELKKDLDTPDVEKPTADSEGEFDIKDKEGGIGDNLECPKFGVADAVQKGEPDEENLEGEEEKAEKKVDLEETADFDALYEETEEDNNEEEAPAEDIEETGDGSCPNCDGEKYGEEISGDKSEIAPSIPDGNADVVATDTSSDVEDVEEVCGEKKPVKEEDEEGEPEDTQDMPEDGGEESKSEDENGGDDVEEAANTTDLDAIYESDDDDEEDAIIDTVEDDTELSDSEVKELIDDDNDDDAIIDDVLGE